LKAVALSSTNRLSIFVVWMHTQKTILLAANTKDARGA